MNYQQYVYMNSDDVSVTNVGDFYLLTRGAQLDPPGMAITGIFYYNYSDGWFSIGIEITIKDGDFVFHPQLQDPPVRFKNLKKCFDHLFKGEFYQGKPFKEAPFLNLLTPSGNFLYKNPNLS